MKDIRRKFASFAAVAMVVVPLLITVYLLYWSPNDTSARQTGKQRVFAATYMTMNNPYFQMLDAQIQGHLELNGDVLLSGFYSDKEIHGVLFPNDGIARAIITSCEQAGQAIPAISGLDAENESVEWVWAGRQYSTVAKPTDALVAQTIEIIKSLQAGNGLPEGTVAVNNGKIDVAVYELPPVVVTKDNAKEVFANDPGRMELLK